MRHTLSYGRTCINFEEEDEETRIVPSRTDGFVPQVPPYLLQACRGEGGGGTTATLIFCPKGIAVVTRTI